MGKILVVDDDPDMQKLILTALQADGHAVVQALDPAEGLALLASEPVDVVITDFMMPKMNPSRNARFDRACISRDAQQCD